MSLNLKKHTLQWDKCSRCHIACFNQQKVFYRGEVPCDLLFVGEAPGDTEIVLGKPFVGPSGKYLSKVVEQICEKYNIVIHEGYTNAVACAPLEDETLRLRAPKNEEIKNCSERLQEIVNLADPAAIVCLGAVAKKAIVKIDTEASIFHAIHPSAILRQGERGALDAARLQAVITDAITEFISIQR